MSSAILYVAIVVIWACVLIPRWLRRDPAHDSSHAPDTMTPRDVAPSYAGSPASSGESAPPGPVADDTQADAPVSAGRANPRDEAERHRADTAADLPELQEAPPRLTPGQSRHRMLSARRRLLGTLIALEIAAIWLAVSGLAALWVVIPPSTMFAGYLLLLREAAHADAERAAREREAAARARTRAREQARARARTARQAATAAPQGTAGWTSPASPAASTVQYEDGGPGRDFAPGLAGKYTTSHADVIDITERAAEDIRHESAENKLRAVGD